MERGESDEDPDEMEELRRSEWTATWRQARMMIRSLIINKLVMAFTLFTHHF